MLFASHTIRILTEDHKKLRKEIEILKDMDLPITERRLAFARLLPRLRAHTKSEEKVIYAFMKLTDSDDLNLWALEGKEEHMLVDQLVKKMLTEHATEEEWSAKGKVLAELVEHHINEEESEIFPSLKSEIDEDIDTDLSDRYETEKANTSMARDFQNRSTSNFNNPN